MASQSDLPPEEKPEYGKFFSREELAAINAFFRGIGINMDIETVKEGDILDICDLIANRFANSGISLGGSPGRALAKAQRVKKQMMADLDALVETVLPVLKDETLHAYLARDNNEKMKFPLDVRAAVARRKLGPHIEQDEQLRELDPAINVENSWLGLMEKLAALYEYCRQISEMPQYRDDEAKIQEAERLSTQFTGELMEHGVLFKKPDRDISNMVMLQTAIALGRNGKA